MHVSGYSVFTYRALGRHVWGAPFDIRYMNSLFTVVAVWMMSFICALVFDQIGRTLLQPITSRMLYILSPVSYLELAAAAATARRFQSGT